MRWLPEDPSLQRRYSIFFTLLVHFVLAILLFSQIQWQLTPSGEESVEVVFEPSPSPVAPKKEPIKSTSAPKNLPKIQSKKQQPKTQQKKEPKITSTVSPKPKPKTSQVKKIKPTTKQVSVIQKKPLAKKDAPKKKLLEKPSPKKEAPKKPQVKKQKKPVPQKKAVVKPTPKKPKALKPPSSLKKKKRSKSKAEAITNDDVLKALIARTTNMPSTEPMPALDLLPLTKSLQTRPDPSLSSSPKQPSTHSNSSTNLAKDSAKALKNYVNNVKAKIRSRLNYPAGISSNPRVVLLITQNKNGEVQSVKLLETSNVNAFDEAVVRAVQAASPLPLPSNMELFQNKVRIVWQRFK